MKIRNNIFIALLMGLMMSVPSGFVQPSHAQATKVKAKAKVARVQSARRNNFERRMMRRIRRLERNNRRLTRRLARFEGRRGRRGVRTVRRVRQTGLRRGRRFRRGRSSLGRL